MIGRFILETRTRMNKATRKRFGNKLNQMLSELKEEVTHTVDGMRVGTGAFPDPTDRASLESERNLTLRIRDRERQLRNKIEDALARIDEGTFGNCEVCGGPISDHRLEARPVTTLCIDCKETEEEDEAKLEYG